ncbi:MAG: adenylyltransferase/cytidyltransferase family protein [Rectinemataceae bacterium]
MSDVFVSGPFDDPRSSHIRFLVEAARIGLLRVLLWPDAVVERRTGSVPRFGFEERRYVLESLRSVVEVLEAPPDLDPDCPLFPHGVAARAAAGGAAEAASGAPQAMEHAVADLAGQGDPPVWALAEGLGSAAEMPGDAKCEWCARRGMAYRVLGSADLSGFPYDPPPPDAPRPPGLKRVVVTGCFDWLHSGHVRFFEEASAYGELNVVIGSDANVRLLKGEGHPMIREAERRFVVGSMRTVARCLVSSGSGWMDAEPEIHALGIDRYIVNEDGDKSDKRRFCEENGIEYIVLERRPKAGLPRRASTDLRGF